MKNFKRNRVLLKRVNTILGVQFTVVFIFTSIFYTQIFAASILLKNNTTIEGRITLETKGAITVQEPRTNKVYNLKRNEINLINRSVEEMEDLEKIKDVYTHILTLKKNKDLNWTEVKPDKKDKEGKVLPTKLYVTIVEKGVNSITVLDYEANIKVKILNDNIDETIDITKLEEIKKKKQEDEEKQAVAGVYSGTGSGIRVGILPSPVMPQGELASVLGMGYGVQFFGDMILTKIGRKSPLRVGGSLGYSTFSTSADDKTATLTMMPILAYGELFYITSMGLKPFVHLGIGATLTSVSGEYEGGESLSGSSTDGTVSIGAGTGYSNRALPKIEFILGAQYMMAFETVTGNFLHITLGAAYNF